MGNKFLSNFRMDIWPSFRVIAGKYRMFTHLSNACEEAQVVGAVDFNHHCKRLTRTTSKIQRRAFLVKPESRDRVFEILRRQIGVAVQF